MKMYEFRKRLFLRFDLKIFQRCNGLAPTKRQAINWINVGLFTEAYMRHLVLMG